MAWEIEYTASAVKTLQSLDKKIAQSIIKYLEERIATDENPRRFGEGLKGNLTEYWKYRIGNYRVIAEIKDEKFIVIVIKLGHRRMVYGGH